MTIELIIYLEPSQQIRQYIEHFLDDCKNKFGPTTANKYGCHITMVGFFNVDDEAQQDDLKNRLDSLLCSFKTTSLPVTSPEPYHQLMRELAHHYPMLRLKRINHISLAYWDEPEATRLEQDNWEKSRKQIFQQVQDYATEYFRDMDSANTDWDVVLYKRKVKGQHVGEKHVFDEIHRWHTHKITEANRDSSSNNR